MGNFSNKVELMKKQIVALFIAGCLLGTGLSSAANSPQPPTDPKQKFAYCAGMSLANNVSRTLKWLHIQFQDPEIQYLLQGVKDQFSGKTLFSQQEARKILRDFQQKAWDDLCQKNLKASEAFLEQNKKRPGIHVTSSGLQYEILKEGKGESPKPNDIVEVNYRGMLIDGTVFDSSYQRGRPSRFMLSRVIPGWREALQMMKPGSKWKIYIPPQLAYGKPGRPPAIGPNQALIFEIELLSIQHPKPSSSHPITSDIIRIPSKQELEKGAKPEIIKPEQLKKLQPQNQQTSKPKK